jgi:hypothetical protein
MRKAGEDELGGRRDAAAPVPAVPFVASGKTALALEGFRRNGN